MKYLKCEKHNIFYPVSDEEFYLTTNPPCPICCPTIIRYGILDSYELENEKYLDAEYLCAKISIGLETTCKHCGHKVLSFLSERIK